MLRPKASSSIPHTLSKLNRHCEITCLGPYRNKSSIQQYGHLSIRLSRTLDVHQNDLVPPAIIVRCCCIKFNQTSNGIYNKAKHSTINFLCKHFVWYYSMSLMAENGFLLWKFINESWKHHNFFTFALIFYKMFFSSWIFRVVSKLILHATW